MNTPIVDKATAQVYGDLWYIRYREKNEVKDAIVRASGYEKAAKVGQAFAESVGARFVRVTPMIVADESILKAPVVARQGL